MCFIILKLSLLFSLNLTLIISKMTITHPNAGAADSLITTKWSITISAFYLISWNEMNKHVEKERKVSSGTKTLTSLIKAIITEETCIKFWIHAIPLDARVVIRPTEHTGAIWVMQSCKDKPWEQGHIDLPSTKSSQTFVLESAVLPFSFLIFLLKKGILWSIGMKLDIKKKSYQVTFTLLSWSVNLTFSFIHPTSHPAHTF